MQLEPVKHNQRLLKAFAVSPTNNLLFSVIALMPD